MASELDVQDLINVQINLTPAGAQAPNLSSMLIIGDSNVIDTKERVRVYSSLSEVATDFGAQAPEYEGCGDVLRSDTLADSAEYRALGEDSDGRAPPRRPAHPSAAAHRELDGGSRRQLQDRGRRRCRGQCHRHQSYRVTNLNGVATAINTAMATALVAATCVWTGAQFKFTSNSTGTVSKIAPLTAAGAGDRYFGAASLHRGYRHL